jgi:phosphoribosylformylglycinamidine synthase
MKATVRITLKNGVLDPQGKAIANTLKNLGFSDIHGVRQGKLIELELDTNDKATAQKQVTEMCENLLANTVIEDYDIELVS